MKLNISLITAIVSGVGLAVIRCEEELAKGMTKHVLERFSPKP